MTGDASPVAMFVVKTHLHFFDKCAHLFDNGFRRNCHLVEIVSILISLSSSDDIVHLCVPMDPYSRVEDLVEEG